MEKKKIEENRVKTLELLEQLLKDELNRTENANSKEMLSEVNKESNE